MTRTAVLSPALAKEIRGREVFAITEADLERMETLMIDYAARRAKR